MISSQSPPPPYSAMPTTNSFGDRLPSQRTHNQHLVHAQKSGYTSGCSSPASIASNGEADPDVFNLAPTSALILLARSVEVLVSLSSTTNISPPTPPHSAPTTPELLANSGTYPGTQTALPSPPSAPLSGFAFGSPPSDSEVDGVWLKPKQQRAPLDDKLCFSQCADQAQKFESITRKFWCKTAPPVSIEDYLFRIHRFCPLSTAVYLAASVYIHRIAMIDRSMVVTRLNVHRLLLAALRVANKGLEDMVMPHARFAKVGGLTDSELAKLEINFCFLVDFEINVDEATLERQLLLLRETVSKQASMGTAAILRTGGAQPVKMPVPNHQRRTGPMVLDV